MVAAKKTSYVHCPICRSKEVSETYRVRELMVGSGEEFQYVSCAECASLRIKEVPEDLAAYYGPEYIRFDAEGGRGRYSTPWKRFSKRCIVRHLVGPGSAVGRVLRRFSSYSIYDLLGRLRAPLLAPDRRILDVGCGAGELLKALDNAGGRTLLGVDAFLPEGQEFEGLRVLRCPLEELEEGPWDTIMFHHSLEHVLDPVATLKAARDRLAPGGAIVVSLPTPSSEAFQRYREHWVGFEPPRHLVLPSRRGLELIGAAAGLRFDGIDDESSAFQFWASEQVRQGVCWSSPESLLNGVGGGTSSAQVAAWEAEAQALNARGAGDQVAAYYGVSV